MIVIPRILKSNSPSCCYLNDRRNLVCVIKDLYDQMNENYEFLSQGGLEDMVEELISGQIDIDGDTATKDQIDSLFGD